LGKIGGGPCGGDLPVFKERDFNREKRKRRLKKVLISRKKNQQLIIMRAKSDVRTVVLKKRGRRKSKTFGQIA